MLRLSSLFLLAAMLCTCDPAQLAPPRYEDRVVELQPEAAAEYAQKVKNESSLEVADGLDLSLWASDSLVQDPIAISVAPDGRIFYTSATRQGDSEFDIRGHRNWMTASLAFKTVEDRRAFLRKTFTAGSEESERSLKDLNQDGVKDWRDLTAEKEQVWFVTDESKDGVADRAQLYLEDFGDEITDVANGIEYKDGDVYISVGPDLWRTRDNDGDGIADVTNSISHGWIVHVGFSGHGMSGVTVGPQGRIWWGAGDVGMDVTDADGNHHSYPNQGVVVRCNPDGSDFEVFARGVRNTHEFAFDDYGNLISVDNDGDHSGERERLVYLIDGSDSGWRINWQFGKYSDPANNAYKVWMDERMHVPREEGQAAYFLPPIQNYVNGPTGLVYNPGTALGPEYYDHFFVAEFRGNPTDSPLHAFKLRPEGAGFALDTTRVVVSGLLPTGVDFGADGALYFGDWINGWGPKEAGRIWKLDVSGEDETAIRRETQRLLVSGFGQVKVDSLSMLLGHQDRRVRQGAQFELVRRGAAGFDVLEKAVRSAANQLARIHGIWGLAQLHRAGRQSKTILSDLLADEDPEIVAQAAKTIGDLRYDGVETGLLSALGHEKVRVRFMAMEALGRTESRAAVEPILDLVEANNDNDLYLRHGAMIALARIGDADAMAGLQGHPSRAVRTVAVVALRRMGSPRIADFLTDADEYLVAEAARGINDDLSITEALPALAASLDDPRFTSEPLLRRAINANLRVGGRESAERLAAFAERQSAPAALRADALATLAHWGHPSVLDRVTGRYRGELVRDSTMAGAALADRIDGLMSRGNETVRTAAIAAAGQLNVNGVIPRLTTFLSRDRSTAVRIAALDALYGLDDPELDGKLETALADRDAAVRARALEILPATDIEPERAVALYTKVLHNSTVEEQQSAFRGLADLPGAQTIELLGEQLDLMEADRLPAAIRLDLAEAIEAQDNQELNDRLTTYAADLDDDLGLYTLALEGGDREAGMHIFYQNEAANCVRCHAVFEYGGNVGPGLDAIGVKLTKPQLLEALIRPSARLAPGYETIMLTLDDGSVTAGTVLERSPETVRIKVGKEDIQTIARNSIAEEESLPSSMPGMEEKLSRREIRDLVTWLATLEGEHAR